MITFTLFSALATFYFTMFFTPGPNNAMLTASGMKFGFLRTLPHLIGIPLGHIFQIGLTCFGLANLFLLYPQVQFYMKILCFIVYGSCQRVKIKEKKYTGTAWIIKLFYIFLINTFYKDLIFLLNMLIHL